MNLFNNWNTACVCTSEKLQNNAPCGMSYTRFRLEMCGNLTNNTTPSVQCDSQHRSVTSQLEINSFFSLQVVHFPTCSVSTFTSLSSLLLPNHRKSVDLSINFRNPIGQNAVHPVTCYLFTESTRGDVPEPTEGTRQGMWHLNGDRQHHQAQNEGGQYSVPAARWWPADCGIRQHGRSGTASRTCARPISRLHNPRTPCFPRFRRERVRR